jgi:hypothetical protein
MSFAHVDSEQSKIKNSASVVKPTDVLDDSSVASVVTGSSLVAGAGTPADTVQTVARSVQQLPNSHLRTQSFTAIQNRRGNAYAARIARQIHNTPVQRHPEGTAVLPQAEAVNEQIQEPATAPAPETAAPETPSSPTAPEQTSSTPAADQATVTPAAPTGSGPAPATPVAGATLQLAYSQSALQSAFGGVATRPIIQGNITIVSGEAAILAAYDTANLGRHNAVTNAPWVVGDAKRNFKDQGSRLNGFADAGRIWIDSTTTDPTTTVHEMLHINTASTFRATVGEVINEGMTERLAVQAVRAQGDSIVGSENTYAPQRASVEKLIGIVGERTMQTAYFNGGQTFIEAYNRIMGSNSFTALKRLLDPLPPNYTAADAVMQPPSATQRIAAINALLDWWVSDNDLTVVQAVFSAASESDKATIRTAIQPRITSLSDLGQRTRLRAILGIV